MKRFTLFLAGLAALVFVPATLAHITANPGEAESGSFAMIDFRVPHGCEDSPTTSITIKIPDGVVFVTPQSVPGWKATTKEGKLATPVEAEGEPITEGVTEVTWTGGPLSPHEFTDFGLSLKLPDDPGTTLLFPAVQRCQKGVTRWIQVPVEGEPEPDTPAPGVKLTTSAGEQAARPKEEAEEDDELGGADLAALGMGAGGLVVGLAALAIALRRRPRT